MDLRHLRHFVAVADELHFGRAAVRLGMSQPPLSQSIQRLEASLGVELFKRARAGVRLTPAGVAFLPHARSTLQQAELAERVARQAAQGEHALLRVGFVPWSLTRALPRAIRRFRLRWPGVQVHLYERVSRQQVTSLRAGELDLAVIRLKMTDTTGLETRLVEISRLVVAVPSAWPLAKRVGLRVADLADQPFVIFPPSLSPASHDTIEAACRAANFRPNVIQETAQPSTMLSMVANELGVALIQNTAAAMTPEGVTLVPLLDAPESFEAQIALAWLPQYMTPVLRAFVDTLAAEAAEEDSVKSSTDGRALGIKSGRE
jgi:DNA-binding transcriptional LysR family regulator